jgi:hypothetical protein
MNKKKEARAGAAFVGVEWSFEWKQLMYVKKS